jgi:hypothetical protein
MDIDYGQLDIKAPTGAFSTFDAQVLVPELVKLQPRDYYLEIGVDKGKSLYIARTVTDPGVLVSGVDIQDDPHIPRTNFFHGDSVEIAKTWSVFLPISILFIDGDHSYEGCKRDIEAWYPHMKPSGIIFFHDHDESSPGVIQAVSEFVNTHAMDHLKSYRIFKRTDLNTSMAAIYL